MMIGCDSSLFLPHLEFLQEKLVKKGKSIATAESCTGGLVSTLLTYLPGSSRVFRGGVCAYDNTVKMTVLGVGEDLLQKHGAVSSQVAEAMASGAARIFKSDYAISITGIAGPDGGTPGKPVGTIWCGFWGPWGVRSQLWTLKGNRTENRAEISLLALKTISDYIDAK